MEINRKKFVNLQIKTSNRLLSNGEISKVVPPERNYKLYYKNCIKAITAIEIGIIIMQVRNKHLCFKKPSKQQQQCFFLYSDISSFFSDTFVLAFNLFTILKSDLKLFSS
jgi:hypothetical protein